VIQEKRRRGNIVLGGVRNEPFERDGRIDDKIGQRRPRSRAASASEVDTGVRRSALLTSKEKSASRRIGGGPGILGLIRVALTAQGNPGKTKGLEQGH